ncbi:MAG: porphobilinogen synthase, partial [Candidatus Zipacnadales bacterium]
MFPETRGRRLRRTENLRRLVRETRLAPDDFIYPLFVMAGRNVRREIPSMPGNFQLSVDKLGPEVEQIVELGIPAVILFGLPERKDPLGSESYA